VTPLEQAKKFVEAELAKLHGRPLTAADEWLLILEIMRRFGLSENVASGIIYTVMHGEPS
jgi:hypothetical protein